MTMFMRIGARRRVPVAFGILLILTTLACSAPGQPQGTTVPTAPPREDALLRTKRTGVIRAAYGDFPPYTIVDPNPKVAVPVTGFAVDLISEIAKRHDPPLRI